MLIDLTGKRFGRLLVIERCFSKSKDIYWFCRCDCGNTLDVSGISLREGRTKSCGCYHKEVAAETGRKRLIDLTGIRFGRLVVIKRGDVPNGEKNNIRKRVYWLCQCDCGNMTTVVGDSLRYGVTMSCGCLSREKTAEVGRNTLIDLTGLRFGMLTVIKRTDAPDNVKDTHEAYWLCKCDCGGVISARGTHLRRGETVSCHHGMTLDDMKARNSLGYKEWRKDVFERDNYTCQKCGKEGNGDLNAHHIKSFANFPDERFNIENGITLCINCHKETDNYAGKSNNRFLVKL